MAFSSCFCHPQISLKTDCSRTVRPWQSFGLERRSTLSHVDVSTKLFGQVARLEDVSKKDCSFMGGSKATIQPKLASLSLYRRRSNVNVSCLASSEIASSVFTFGTVAVLPFYTLMILAPRARLTGKFMDNSIPYVVLGLLYAYLLYLSWTPDTIRSMFASKYFLPELSGMVKMFSSEMTLASAWIHLLAIDLFAARQVFRDGLENEIETRHSVSLCLLFCPVGIITHVITKAVTKSARDAKHSM